MNTFESFKSSCYHKVSIGPFEERAKQLVFSDTVLHLPVLEYYASLCEHVTEFGVRDGESTSALIGGCTGDVHSYDIQRTPIVDFLEGIELPCRSWTFHRGSTIDPSLGVSETDMLYVDTLHTYDHVSQELSLWGRKARRFIAFHDTFACGEFDVSGLNPKARGILPAIEEFIQKHPGDYETAYRTNASNGLWILKRTH